MIELHLDLKLHMKTWKKALLFSLIFYLIILFIFVVVITFMLKDFKFGLVGAISAVYIGILLTGFRLMYGIFDKKFKILLEDKNKE